MFDRLMTLTPTTSPFASCPPVRKYVRSLDGGQAVTHLVLRIVLFRALFLLTCRGCLGMFRGLSGML